MPKSSHTAKKKFPSLSPYHRLNATVRQPKYVKDAVTYLKACQKVISKFPKEEQKKNGLRSSHGILITLLPENGGYHSLFHHLMKTN